MKNGPLPTRAVRFDCLDTLRGTPSTARGRRREAHLAMQIPTTITAPRDVYVTPAMDRRKVICSISGRLRTPRAPATTAQFVAVPL